MAQVKKLGRATDQRLAVLRNQASYLLWNEKLETTVEKAKATRSYAERLITLAVNTYEDVITVEKEVVDAKGKKSTQKVTIDGPKKLAARRKLMSKLYDIQELRQKGEAKADFVKRTEDIAHPLIEKIFNVYAPKYAKRKAELGQGGGYTRIVKLGNRKGDNAEMALVEMI